MNTDKVYGKGGLGNQQARLTCLLFLATFTLACSLGAWAQSDPAVTDHSAHHPKPSPSTVSTVITPPPSPASPVASMQPKDVNPPEGTPHTQATTPAGPLTPLQKLLEKQRLRLARSNLNSQAQTPSSQPSGAPNAQAMGPGSPSSGGGMMDMMSQMMNQMMGGGGGSGMGAMGAPPANGMAPANGMPASTPQANTSLPGFPGSSHIYHVGSTGFFLNHARLLALTPEQSEKLGQIRERELLHQSQVNRKLAQAEEDLWLLTGSDRPDLSSIEAKLKKIEGLRTMKRLYFIRSVGKAAQVLTPKQMKLVLGTGEMQGDSGSGNSSP